jgi:hypothetical protein
MNSRRFMGSPPGLSHTFRAELDAPPKSYPISRSMSLRLRTLPAGFIEPSSTKRPPTGHGWLHEIKHEGLPGDRPQDRQAGEALQPPRQ